MLMYCVRLILFSIVFCIVLRKFISPLFRRYHDKKTWLVMSEMLKAGDTDRLEEYLSRYAKETPHASLGTGNAGIA
jgi:hypothetical protein